MHDRNLLPAFATAVALSAGAIAGHALADINVGVTLSATGPAASLGIPEKNTFELLPTTIGGQKVNWIVLDDGSDTTKAVTNTRKLISEDKVDVIVGSTITPNSLAMVDVVAEAETPMISMAASARIVDPTQSDPRTVQDAAERLADGRRDRRAHEGEWRERRWHTSASTMPTATAGSRR